MRSKAKSQLLYRSSDTRVYSCLYLQCSPINQLWLHDEWSIIGQVENQQKSYVPGDDNAFSHHMYRRNCIEAGGGGWAYVFTLYMTISSTLWQSASSQQRRRIVSAVAAEDCPNPLALVPPLPVRAPPPRHVCPHCRKHLLLVCPCLLLLLLLLALLSTNGLTYAKAKPSSWLCDSVCGDHVVSAQKNRKND